jgi:DNA-binding Lrp family transcriptional regulator
MIAYRHNPKPSAPKKSWRDVIAIHPAAEWLPSAGERELRELAGDILSTGQREPVTLIERDGALHLADGRSRLDGLELLGREVVDAEGKLTVPHRVIDLPDDKAVIAYVMSMNAYRRHLTAEQKRELMNRLLKEAPEKSDRQIGALVAASPTTVGKERKKLEASGAVPKMDTATDRKGRKQTRKKKSRPRTPGGEPLKQVSQTASESAPEVEPAIPAFLQRDPDARARAEEGELSKAISAYSVLTPSAKQRLRAYVLGEEGEAAERTASPNPLCDAWRAATADERDVFADLFEEDVRKHGSKRRAQATAA